MDADLVVRPATLEDTEPVRRVGLLAWPETYAFAGEDFIRRGLEQWWSPEAVQRSLATTTTLLAELEATVVGMGNVDLRGEVPVVWKLYVLPEHQGRGVGGVLLQGLLDLAAGRPVELEHVAGNDRAAAFYARQGFREVRRETAQDGAVSVWLRREPQLSEAVPAITSTPTAEDEVQPRREVGLAG